MATKNDLVKLIRISPEHHAKLTEIQRRLNLRTQSAVLDILFDRAGDFDIRVVSVEKK